jgi:thiol:disulfide interchange protein
MEGHKIRKSYFPLIASGGFVFSVLALLTTGGAFGQSPTVYRDPRVLDPVVKKTDLYPSDANAEKEIESALQRASAEKKRVMLVFGANWCYDCHVLDRALHQGTAARIMARHFILVHVDIGEGQRNTELIKKYKVPVEKGVPALTLLARDGHILYSANGEFEAARRMLKNDLIAFLNHWKGAAR